MYGWSAHFLRLGLFACIASAVVGCPGAQSTSDAGDGSPVRFDIIFPVDAVDASDDFAPIDFGPAPDVPPTCGFMICDPGFRCCSSTLACYDPAMPFLCPMLDASRPPDAAVCGGVTCGLGLLCCTTNMRCVDPTIPSMCPPLDGGICARVTCPISWRCCEFTGVCYDDRFPEQCVPRSDAGRTDVGTTDGPPGVICGMTRCGAGELCCASTLRCEPVGCPDCCR